MPAHTPDAQSGDSATEFTYAVYSTAPPTSSRESVVQREASEFSNTMAVRATVESRILKKG